MRRMRNWLLVLGTVLLIAIGAGMPWAAARFQDLYGVASQEVLPFDPVSLTLRKDTEIGAVLRLLSGDYDQMEWFGETRLTEDDACTAALDALAELDRYGLLEAGYLGYYGYVEVDILEHLKADGASKATPVLCDSHDGATAILWICSWKGVGTPSYELLIDDTTGKAVYGYIPCSHPEDMEAFYQRAWRWVDFFQDYYGIETLENVELDSSDLPQFFCRLDLEDGEEEVGMLVSSAYFEMMFSPASAEMVGLTPYLDDNAAILPDLSEDIPGVIFDINVN